MTEALRILRVRRMLVAGLLLLVVAVPEAHAQAKKKAGGGGDTVVQGTPSGCLLTVNGHSGLKVGVSWSGDRVSGGRYTVETDWTPVNGGKFEHTWSLPRAERSGTNSHVFELFESGINGQAQAVSFELSTEGKVAWTGMMRSWDLKPCP